MTRIDCDIAVLGSGFGGTLLAIVARKLGYSVALLERTAATRDFAIGESSTPLADFKLAAIAATFGLDWLKPFAKYGSWKTRYPDIRCGPKRGFSFFRHEPNRSFSPHGANANSLLVAANPDEPRTDTHWFRADIDAHLVRRTVDAEVVFLDHLEIDCLRHECGWHLSGKRPDKAVSVRAGVMIDATGDGQLFGHALGLETMPPSTLHTRSRACTAILPAWPAGRMSSKSRMARRRPRSTRSPAMPPHSTISWTAAGCGFCASMTASPVPAFRSIRPSIRSGPAKRRMPSGGDWSTHIPRLLASSPRSGPSGPSCARTGCSAVGVARRARLGFVASCRRFS